MRYKEHVQKILLNTNHLDCLKQEKYYVNKWCVEWRDCSKLTKLFSQVQHTQVCWRLQLTDNISLISYARNLHSKFIFYNNIKIKQNSCPCPSSTVIGAEMRKVSINWSWRQKKPLKSYFLAGNYFILEQRSLKCDYLTDLVWSPRNQLRVR